MALAMAIGYDKISSNRVMITASFPQTAEEAKEPNETIQVISRSEKNAREKMRPLAGKTVVAGQAKTILFGEKTARQGIQEYAQSFLRDPSVNSMVFQGIVKGKAGDVVKKKYPD
jgi:spore germination protein